MMSEEQAIIDVTGAEAAATIVQFMGQQMGTIKELNNSFVSKSTNLSDVSFKADEIVRGMAPANNHTPYVQLPQAQPSLPVTILTSKPAATPTLKTAVPVDPSQPEFNFTYDIAKDIVDRLERIEALLRKALAQPTPKKS